MYLVKSSYVFQNSNWIHPFLCYQKFWLPSSSNLTSTKWLSQNLLNWQKVKTPKCLMILPLSIVYPWSPWHCSCLASSFPANQTGLSGAIVMGWSLDPGPVRGLEPNFLRRAQSWGRPKPRFWERARKSDRFI